MAARVEPDLGKIASHKGICPGPDLSHSRVGVVGGGGGGGGLRLMTSAGKYAEGLKCAVGLRYEGNRGSHMMATVGNHSDGGCGGGDGGLKSLTTGASVQVWTSEL